MEELPQNRIANYSNQTWLKVLSGEISSKWDTLSIMARNDVITRNEHVEFLSPNVLC